jgi:hypothetical protein
MDHRAICQHPPKPRREAKPSPPPVELTRAWWARSPKAVAAAMACFALVLAVLTVVARPRPRLNVVGGLAPELALALVEPALEGNPGESLQQAPRPAAHLEPRQAERPAVESLALPTPVAVVVELLPTPNQERPPDVFKRRNLATEGELQNALAGAEEVGLGLAGKNLFRNYIRHLRQTESRGGPKGPADCEPVLALGASMAWLPLRDGPGRTISAKAAAELATLSGKLRLYLNAVVPPGPDGHSRDMKLLRERLRADLRGKKPEWLRAAAVPALNQRLMGEDAATRRLLVELLAEIPEKPATLALTQRAVFDLAADVRAAAVEALKGRDPEAWRPELLRALKHPWPPLADFAAEALVRLRDAGSVPELLALLDAPRPGRPVTLPDKRVVIREVVKVKHEKNCMLCHPPAVGRNEPVVRGDPTWLTNGKTTDPELVAAVQVLDQRRAAASKGKYGGGRPSSSPGAPILIRGDITFMKQDFSVSFPVSDPARQPPLVKEIVQNNLPAARALGLIPPPVRFDYVVRTRPVQPAELKKWRAIDEERNPQREAVLFALRELTGQDHGLTTLAWKRAFPDAERELQTRRLAERLVKSPALEAGALLLRYGEAAGAEHTYAIARAIPKMQGFSREAARLALTSRLAKEPPEALPAHLSDGDAEVRLAAVRVAVQREDRSLAPDLLPLLDDPATSRAARKALKQLTGQELPDAGAWHKWFTGVASRP